MCGVLLELTQGSRDPSEEMQFQHLCIGFILFLFYFYLFFVNVAWLYMEGSQLKNHYEGVPR